MSDTLEVKVDQNILDVRSVSLKAAVGTKIYVAIFTFSLLSQKFFIPSWYF